jgi:hypothetical protein
LRSGRRRFAAQAEDDLLLGLDAFAPRLKGDVLDLIRGLGDIGADELVKLLAGDPAAAPGESLEGPSYEKT